MPEPKRILILVTSLDRGGIETMIMNYYRRLDRSKWQFDFLINRPEAGSYEKEVKELGGKIFRMGSMYPWRYLSYKKEFSKFLKTHPEYDIIHSHLEERSYWPLCIAKKMGVPVRICHAHNIYPFSPKSPKSYFRERFRLGLRREGLVTLRLACSAHAGKWLYGKHAKFTIITNAIDFDALKYDKSSREELRRELGIAPETHVAGFVGRLVSQKNPEFALRVFSALENREEWVLIVVGKGEAFERLKNLSAELGVKKQVIFAGEVPNIAKYYSAFDVLLMPSRHEGLGMVAIEAGASGLPVLASDRVPSEANVVKNIKFIALDLTEKWLAEIKNSVSKKREGVVKMTKLMEPYDIQIAVKRLEEIYEDLTY